MIRRALCAAAASTTCARGIYEYKFGQTPLTKPFKPAGHNNAHTVRADTSPVPASPPAELRVTKLHNGARVITQNFGGPVVSVGAYIRAGSVYDPPNCPGVAAMMHLALTTSNYNNSLFQLDRNIRSVGAAEAHFEKYKHYIGLRIDVRADKWRGAAASTEAAGDNLHSAMSKQAHYDLTLTQDNLFTCLAAPRFHEADIERFRDTMDNQLKELKWQHPDEYAVLMLETVAFYKEPLGNPRFVPENNNSNIGSQLLLEQYSRYITPRNVVIAGVNIDHEALIAEYENTPYPHSAAAPHHSKVQTEVAKNRAGSVDTKDEAAQYTGGERLDQEDRAKDMGTKPDMDPEAICAVGWLAYGRDRTMLRDYAASMVLRHLLDVFFKDTLHHAEDHGCTRPGTRTFYNPYQTAGLLGITVVADPQHITRQVTDAVRVCQGLQRELPSKAHLTAAKSRAVLQFINEHTDSVRDYCDYLGTSLPLEDEGTTPTRIEEVVRALQAVTETDVQRVCKTMFDHPTTLYAHGEVLDFPSLRQLGL